MARHRLRDLSDPACDGGRIELRDERNAALGDRRLSPPAMSVRPVAEELLMVEREIGDPGDQRTLDDVGRVEPAAEPDLEDAGVGRRPGKGEDARPRSRLRRSSARSRRSRRALRSSKCRQRLVLDQPAGDADSLVEADQVRAGEGVDLVPARFERGAKEGDGRAFAVGPGDVEHRRKPVLRPAEPVEQRGDALEAEPVAGGRQHGQAIELRLDAGMRRAREVGHHAAAFASGAR